MCYVRFLFASFGLTTETDLCQIIKYLLSEADCEKLGHAFRHTRTQLLFLWMDNWNGVFECHFFGCAIMWLQLIFIDLKDLSTSPIKCKNQYSNHVTRLKPKLLQGIWIYLQERSLCNRNIYYAFTFSVEASLKGKELPFGEQDLSFKITQIIKWIPTGDANTFLQSFLPWKNTAYLYALSPKNDPNDKQLSPYTVRIFISLLTVCLCL